MSGTFGSPTLMADIHGTSGDTERVRLDITEEEAARERERLVRYIVATFDVESGVDVSADLMAMARVREAAAAAHEHRMALRHLEEHVIDLPNLAPAASFHHSLSLGTLAVICTGERPPPDPEQVRADRQREIERRAEKGKEEAARNAASSSNVPFIVGIGVVIVVASSMVWAMHSCGSHPEHEPAEKSEHRK
jgi:hypothetical protein